jgi:hypothetical protein
MRAGNPFRRLRIASLEGLQERPCSSTHPDGYIEWAMCGARRPRALPGGDRGEVRGAGRAASAGRRGARRGRLSAAGKNGRAGAGAKACAVQRTPQVPGRGCRGTVRAAKGTPVGIRRGADESQRAQRGDHRVRVARALSDPGPRATKTALLV